MPDGHDLSLFDVHPHLGLISLATVLQEEGHQVTIYDPKREVRFGRCAYNEKLYEKAALDILKYSPEAIGFTTLGCSFLFASNVAADIKRREPEIPILLGGPHATMLDRRILESHCQFDVVVRHEAEKSLPLVLAGLTNREFKAIPGISWRNKGRNEVHTNSGSPLIADLDCLPVPSYDFYPIQQLKLKFMRIEAGRGCPFVCTFCSTASFFQRDYRLKSAGRLVAEMDALHGRYGANEFKLDHDLFTVNRRKVLAFCDAVQDRNYKWRVQRALIALMKDCLKGWHWPAALGFISASRAGRNGYSRLRKSVSSSMELSEY